jgi:hypothetical protein
MMASRFATVNPTEIEALAGSAKNNNTIKSTRNWLNVFMEWAKQRQQETDIAKYTPPADLDMVLCRFYAEIRKQDGGEYEPDSLRVMQSALQRELRNKNSPLDILNDLQFHNSREVLEGKARQLRAAGMGRKPNASKALTKAEEKILWETGRLGDSTPTWLLRTMWFNNTEYFGLRGVQEHITMTMDNFLHKTSEEGRKYIEFVEDPTKCRQSGLRPKLRVSNTKMFAVGGSRCPVRLFQYFVSKRPADMRNAGRFYLTPRRPVDDYLACSEWYLRNPMGKNKISSIMKELISGTDVELSRKKLTNHSGRKTCIKRLKAAKIPESSIIKVTGHTSTQGLRSYDPEDEGEFSEMSNVIQGVANDVDFEVAGGQSTVNQNINKPHPAKPQPHSKTFNPFRPFASMIEQEESTQTSNSFQEAPFKFENCNVTINFNHGGKNTSSSANIESQTHKRKRLIIYSSSEDELSQS